MMGDVRAAELPLPSTPAPWGVVLLAHGSRQGNETTLGLREVQLRLQERLREEQALVSLACLEFMPPTLEEAIRILASQGLRRITIVPYLLGQGKHATEDIDSNLAEIRNALPDVQIHRAAALGCDPRLAEVVAERVLRTAQQGFQSLKLGPSPERGQQTRSALDRGHAPDVAVGDFMTEKTIGVLLVKAGTKSQYDDCLWLQTFGEMVARRLGPGYAVAVAQSHHGPPTMEEAVARLAKDKGIGSLICVPYVFFSGLILHRNILGGLDQLKSRYPKLPVLVAPTLGVDDRLVAIADDRVREARRSLVESRSSP